MRDDEQKVTIIHPDDRLEPMRRRRGGAFRPYDQKDGQPPDSQIKPVKPPAERRRRRRGPGDQPRGSIVDVES